MKMGIVVFPGMVTSSLTTFIVAFAPNAATGLARAYKSRWWKALPASFVAIFIICNGGRESILEKRLL